MRPTVKPLGWFPRYGTSVTRLNQPHLGLLLQRRMTLLWARKPIVGLDRNLALVRSSMDLVKDVAHAHNATVNDVLLMVTAGGVRALLRSRGEPVEDITMRISVPVSLRRGEGGPAQGNLIGDMVVPVRLAVSNPVRRLQQIAAETARRKTRSRTSLGTFFGGGFADYLLLRTIARQLVNVTTTNIHGAKLPLYLTGARVLEVSRC